MEHFIVTEAHLNLVDRMNIKFDESGYDGAPVVDMKRPYGNSSVVYDVYEIVNGYEWDSDEDMPDVIYEEMLQIHRDTAKVLQIIIDTKSFEPGLYCRPEHRFRRIKWARKA